MSGISADVELVRPALAEGGAYGVEGTAVPGKGELVFAFGTQFEREPVLVRIENVIAESPVANRAGGWLGVAAGLGRRVSLQATVPMAWQVGDESVFSADGFGLADPHVGARWGVVRGRFGAATLRADLGIPIGAADAWLGEDTARGAFGVSGSLGGRLGSLLVDAGIVARPEADPLEGLGWGPTAELGLGLRAELGARAAVTGSWVGRRVLAGPDADAEVASEALAGVQVRAMPALVAGAGGGVGIHGGVGAATWRAFGTLTWTVEPRKPDVPPPPKALQAAPLDDRKILEIEAVAPPPKPEWDEGQLAKIVGDEIVFREEIHFAPDSAEILPESRPVLDQVAGLLQADGRIAHLAIEGHASEEGDLLYNWDLSDRRARAVWEALIGEGIHPERMSWRGLGEVVPVRDGGGEAAKVASRRVVLRIARRLAPGEALPEQAASVLLPWSGEAAAVAPVVLPEPPVLEEKEPKGEERVDPRLFSEPHEEEQPKEEEGVNPNLFDDDEEEAP